MLRLLAAITLSFFASTAASAGQAIPGFVPTRVDLQLVLAADASGSITRELAAAQRVGFAKAFRDTSLHRALQTGPLGRIAVTYFEWAEPGQERVIVPWTVLSSPQDADRFADALDASMLQGPEGNTSIAGAMDYAGRLFASSGMSSMRKVVDISGNGRDEHGDDLALALHQLVEEGAVVNGLALPLPAYQTDNPFFAMMNGHDSPLVDYYRSEVIGGPGSFAIAADPKDGFGDAILRKLVLEVAWVTPRGFLQ